MHYYYDSDGQLTRVDNEYTENSTSVYTYDSRGNVTEKKVYPFTRDETITSAPTETKTFTYANSGWKDQLIKVNNDELTYDANGNVLTFGNRSFTWNTGRNLASITEGSNTYSYTYDENGIRTSKTVNGVTTYYNTKDGVILSQNDGTNTMYFQYDSKGIPLGFILNGTQYFYLTNQMGDVIAITESNGEIIGEYIYDEWGYILSENTMNPDINPEQVKAVKTNPLRYRGYYYDSETGYYYLQSRYYDPSICRFINADIPEIAQMSKDVSVDTNLFAYCNNNPTNKADYNGALPQYILNVLGSIRGLLTAYVFRVLSRLGSMCYLSAANRALIIYNYIRNRRQAKQPNGYIKDQEKYTSWRLGFFPLSYNGCEVISIYNVLLKLGKYMKLENIILASGLCGYVMLYGALGSSPTSLWRLFSLLSIKYKMTYSVNTLNNRGKKAKAIIVSCWNKGWFSGLHTFMVVYSNGKYRSYNGYHDDVKYDSIQALLAGRRFIVGYYFN